MPKTGHIAGECLNVIEMSTKRPKNVIFLSTGTASQKGVYVPGIQNTYHIFLFTVF